MTRYRALVFGVGGLYIVVYEFDSMPRLFPFINMVYASYSAVGLIGEHVCSAVFLDPSKSASDTDTSPTFWTMDKVSIGLMAACFPTLKPLLIKTGGL